MKKILVPCDFSPTAIQAFKFAANIARKSKGEIILLNVVEMPVLRHGPVPINAMEKVFLKGIRARVDKDFTNLIETWGKGIKVSLTIEHGAVNDTIIKNIKKKRADLVVIGTHGASGIREFFIGSNAEKVIRFSPVPVISVKKNFKTDIKNIAFATDLSDLPKKVSEKLIQLQKFFKAHLHIGYINTPFNFKTESALRPLIKDFMKRNGFGKDCSSTIYSDYDLVAGIRNFAKDTKADIVAVPTHSKKGLTHFIFGSVAEDVTNHIECPIWTYSTES
jgi:nucleotide-binding universal stress UspA family protein